MTPLESVPNVSAGRDPEVVDDVGDAFGARAALLDVHSDPDHNRSVYTIAARTDADLEAAVLDGIVAAVERIDLRDHTGVHPRVGVADVVPFVHLHPGDTPRAAAAALAVGRIVGEELGVPVFLYGDVGGGRRPAFFRRGGVTELAHRVETGELAPSFGPRRLHPTAGAALVGARPPLVAFNLELATPDLDVARAIAARVRESGGGMPGVQAIGLLLAHTGNAQVSTNVIDVAVAPLHALVGRVRLEAAACGVRVLRGELVGLVPAAVVQRAAGAPDDALPDEESLDAAARALMLDSLPMSAVLELCLRQAGLAGDDQSSD